jgi:hypothetical protein
MSTPKINQHIYRQFQFDFNDVQRPAERCVEHRTFADAGPLGLCAFAATLLLISLINLRADNVVNQSMVIGMGMSSLSSSEMGSFSIWWRGIVLCWDVGFCKREYLSRSRFPLLFRVADKLCDYLDSIFQYRRCIPNVSRFQYRAWVILDLYVCPV